MKQQFLEGKADTIKLTIYKDNRKVVPSSATIVLKKPGGSILQSSASATVASDGQLSYALTTTHTADKDLNYKAVWSYVISGTTHTEEQLFDVVLSRLSIPITDDDIFVELPSLKRIAEQITGTSTAGAAGTLTDTRRKEDDDFWTGGIIQIINGTGEGQKRSISDFVQSTGVISVSPDWTTNPDTTSVYRIIKSFSDTILQCFEKIETMFYNKGKRHSLIIESSQIRIPLIFLTVHFICLDLTDEVDDKWSVLAASYGEKFDKMFSMMKVDYDADESGTIDEEEQQTGINEVRIFRS